ncbi:MAG: hypothetical protein ACRDMA_17420 [Solirubrobacterales bacterium]
MAQKSSHVGAIPIRGASTPAAQPCHPRPRSSTTWKALAATRIHRTQS